MQLLGYGIEKKPFPNYPPKNMTKKPPIRPDRGSPKIHPPKRKEKTKTLAPDDLSSK
jgi:hypothetical protein